MIRHQDHAGIQEDNNSNCGNDQNRMIFFSIDFIFSFLHNLSSLKSEIKERVVSTVYKECNAEDTKEQKYCGSHFRFLSAASHNIIPDQRCCTEHAHDQNDEIVPYIIKECQIKETLGADTK